MKTATPDVKDQVSSRILWALSDGRAYTAIELADYAQISKNKMEDILDQMVQDHFLVLERHHFCYYKFPNEEAAKEFGAQLYSEMKAKKKIYPKDEKFSDMKYCRSCHGHLAGKVGVLLTEKMQEKQFFYKERVGEEYVFILTEKGMRFFKDLGIDAAIFKKATVKACLDFSERKHHLGGSLGVAFLNKMIKNGWIQKIEHSRIKIPTKKGRIILNEKLGVILQCDDLT